MSAASLEGEQLSAALPEGEQVSTASLKGELEVSLLVEE